MTMKYTPQLTSIYSLTLNELQNEFSRNSFKELGATELYRNLYKTFNSTLDNVPNIAENSIRFIKENYSLELPKISKIQKSDDLTVKFLMEMRDGYKVETVLIPFAKKYTICLSSQVGCAMKCSFCFTGKQGLARNLETHEIVGQYIIAYKWLRENRPEKIAPPNIVFMGQGEPLHNFDHVKKAIGIFLVPQGLHIGFRQITLSTAGYLPGLKRYSELPNINLALSLHSPVDEHRSTLIPLNKKFNLETLFKNLDEIKLLKRQFITYEYLLIKDLNDRDEDIELLAKWLVNRRSLINIIPFNEFPGAPYKRPTNERVLYFRDGLEKYGLNAKIRTTMGGDILAACGQLNTKEKLQEHSIF